MSWCVNTPIGCIDWPIGSPAASKTCHDGQDDTLLSFNRAAAAIDLRNVADPSKLAVAWR